MATSISEEFRLFARDWLEKDDAARFLEDTKSAVLSQMILARGDVPVAHAERDVKASDEWSNHVKKIVRARTQANEAKLKLDWIKMRHSEQLSTEANNRAEMKL